MQDLEFLKTEKITHILNCTQEVELPKNVEAYIKGFQRISIQDKANEDLLAVIFKGIIWIDEVLSNEKNIILIHCREGKSRSASFLCGYLIWKENIAFESALSAVRSRRTVAMPNPKFFKQLEEFSAIVIKEQELPAEKRTFPPSKYDFKLMPVKQ
ncbi:Dual specificity phosphatase, catalytic domain containing protein [Reticulomyxa filosa]|uniref:Dual specificity phosphatase, catalytic domain containing protein n=1 Tax=Reticulomyxa filosa TaxID=46433 RepID=X6NH18_RETFI|nr:Dual specificity phosphatase, catalytic domain containing protein [Reticulomyxa filosa]|eukprot:ETO25019.1 Dual specificity phosphatase, catalytic domain containing protein [Reticulomyxa filosa]